MKKSDVMVWMYLKGICLVYMYSGRIQRMMFLFDTKSMQHFQNVILIGSELKLFTKAFELSALN